MLILKKKMITYSLWNFIPSSEVTVNNSAYLISALADKLGYIYLNLYKKNNFPSLMHRNDKKKYLKLNKYTQKSGE